MSSSTPSPGSELPGLPRDEPPGLPGDELRDEPPGLPGDELRDEPSGLPGDEPPGLPGDEPPGLPRDELPGLPDVEPATRPRSPRAAPTFGAILLAGGRATRVDGAAKPLFEVGGATLLGRAVASVTAVGARPVLVAAPVLDPALSVEWVVEDPPFGGPVAGVVAALSRSSAWEPEPEWTFLLACDLPRIDAAVERLRSDILLLPSDTDGACLADASSRPQWLTGIYRTRALRRAANAMPDGGRDAPVRDLLADLAIAAIPVPGDLTADVDTWEDLKRARAAAGDAPEEDA